MNFGGERTGIYTSQFFNTPPPLYLLCARLHTAVRSKQCINLLQRDAMDVYSTAIQGLICKGVVAMHSYCMLYVGTSALHKSVVTERKKAKI